MRFVLLALLSGLLVTTAGATTIVVPDENLGIRAIQQGIDLAAPGDTVLVMSGLYDSVHSFETPIGRRQAIAAIRSEITLIGDARSAVKIDFLDADYGILCLGVGADAVISDLTIVGGGSRDRGRTDDGDGRLLSAGICCLDAASPTIVDVDIENGATGVVIRTQPGSDDSAPTLTGVVIARGSHHGVYVYDNGSSPVVIDRCTFVDNYDYGVYGYNADIEISNSAITHNGKYGLNAYQSTMDVAYCNVYWNDQMFPDS
jgi:hypothetical protein